MALLEVRNITKTFNGIHALEDVSFDIEQGSIVGLIGPNGSGKSTFFNVLMSALKKDAGTIVFDRHDITNQKTYQIAKLGIARTFQDSKPLPQITVRENLDVAFHYQTPVSLSHVFTKSKKLKNEERNNEKRIRELLTEVNIPEKENRLAENLSYGQSKLLEILKVMVANPKLILLDEPFSGLFPRDDSVSNETHSKNGGRG